MIDVIFAFGSVKKKEERWWYKRSIKCWYSIVANVNSNPKCYSTLNFCTQFNSTSIIHYILNINNFGNRWNFCIPKTHTKIYFKSHWQQTIWSAIGKFIIKISVVCGTLFHFSNSQITLGIYKCMGKIEGPPVSVFV